MEEDKIIKVKLVDTPNQIGNAGSALTFIFTMITMCIWGIYAGIYTGPATLAVGIVQFACFIPFMVGALLFYFKGDSLNGNAFLIFATLFAGVGGLSNIFLGFAEIFGWQMSNQLTCIPFIWGGICIAPITWVLRKLISKVTFICYASAFIFLVLIGLVGLNIIPAAVNTPIKWLGLTVALTGYYECLNGLLVDGGHKPLPHGKPFFQ